MKLTHTLAAAAVAAVALTVTGCSNGDTTQDAAATTTTVDTGGFNCDARDASTGAATAAATVFRDVAATTSDTGVAAAATAVADAAEALAAAHPGIGEMTAERFAALSAEDQQRYAAAINEMHERHADDMATVWEYLDTICPTAKGGTGDANQGN